jgi:hypothetical protein
MVARSWASSPTGARKNKTTATATKALIEMPLSID